MSNNYTHTVHCFDDSSKRRHCATKKEAIAYANELLAAGHKVKIYPYRPQRGYVDILAEQGPPPGMKVK